MQVVQEDVPQLMPDKATAGASTLVSVASIIHEMGERLIKHMGRPAS